MVWKWLAQLVALITTFALVWAAHRWSRRLAPGHKVREQLRALSVPVAFLLLVPLLAYVTRAHINVTGMGAQLEQVLVPGLTYLALAWLIWRAAIFAAELIISSPRIPDQGLDAHLLRLMARVLGLIGVVAVLMWGGNRLGLPLYGLIAGVSVGGLAVALAAQGTVENFIGSLNLFADRPVRIGETCRYGDDVGTVEEIGLRSTRLRGSDRTVTTVPNADFSKMKIVNLSRRDRLLTRTTLGLRYETTPDQMRYLLTRLREMLAAHPRVAVDTPRVRFVGFGDFALNVEMQAYVATVGLRGVPRGAGGHLPAHDRPGGGSRHRLLPFLRRRCTCRATPASTKPPGNRPRLRWTPGAKRAGCHFPTSLRPIHSASRARSTGRRVARHRWSLGRPCPTATWIEPAQMSARRRTQRRADDAVPHADARRSRRLPPARRRGIDRCPTGCFPADRQLSCQRLRWHRLRTRRPFCGAGPDLSGSPMDNNLASRRGERTRRSPNTFSHQQPLRSWPKSPAAASPSTA